MENTDIKLIISEISNKNTTCIFVSPHLDDAILSAGELISELSKKTKVKAVNVFTKGSAGPYSIFTKAFMNKCGYANANSLFDERKREDNKVFKSMGIDTINLDFTDAGWRKFNNLGFFRKFLSKFIPDFAFIYPLHPLQINSGRINQQDLSLINEVAHKIKDVLDKDPEALVFCPLSLESHIDHIIVRKSCEKICDRIIYWRDLPYNYNGNFPSDLFCYKNESQTKNKLSLVSGYATQIKSLFKNNQIFLQDEMFFMNNLTRLSITQKSKITVLVGIAAYNAENRIEGLLGSLIEQKESGFVIDKIIVHCDNCSDKTVEICEKFKKDNGVDKILTIDNRDRRGFALSSLAMMDITNGVFVLLNDDIRLSDDKFIFNIIRPIIEDESVGLTSGRLLPIKGRTFIENAVISTFNAYDNMRLNMKDKNNQFSYDGASMALSRRFIDSIKIPDPITDLGNMDAFLYFSCRVNNFKYVYATDAVLYHRYPSTFIDYNRQLIRNNAQPYIMYRQFREFGVREYKKPKLIFLWFSLIEFIKNPLGCSFVFVMRIYIKIMAKKLDKKSNLVWEIVDSSKEKI